MIFMNDSLPERKEWQTCSEQFRDDWGMAGHNITGQNILLKGRYTTKWCVSNRYTGEEPLWIGHGKKHSSWGSSPSWLDAPASVPR